MSTVSDGIDSYISGKKWYWYLPLWLLGLYMYVELFEFNMVKQQMPLIWLVPYSFDFLLHEIAHIATAFLPPVLTASAGSGSEVLLGTLLIAMAVWQRSYFASLFCFLWFALACDSAGQYMADAVPQRLQLVSLGGALSGQDPLHDWHFVFGQLHLLGASAFIGNSLRAIGFLVGLAGVAFTAWLLYKMAADGHAEARQQHLQDLASKLADMKGQDTQDSLYPEATKGQFVSSPGDTSSETPLLDKQ